LTPENAPAARRANERRPNILVVVLDCMRSREFPGGADPVTGMAACERLRRESLVFPEAVAPAPWTIPSHASLFTGRYPWDHKAHSHAGLFLDPSVPTLAETLGTAGYASVSLSANGFISPEFGLVRGFGAAGWGDWWEKYFRLPSRTLPPWGFGLGPTQSLPTGRVWKSMTTRVWYTHRLPIGWAALNAVAHRVRYRDAPNPMGVAPWIEPTLTSWLSRQPQDRPVFCFVNLMEAHEPFFADPAATRGLGQWLSYSRQRMDRTSVLVGSWHLTAKDLQTITELYRQSVKLLDARIAGIIDVMKSAGRWDDTIMVVTGDHGQALGEHGFLFHAIKVTEPVVRVPLWYRHPSGRLAGVTVQQPANLIDVFPTVLEDAGVSPVTRTEGVNLAQLAVGPRTTPSFTMSEGVDHRSVLDRLMDKSRVDLLDRVMVAAYHDSVKLVWDATDLKARAFRLDVDSQEENDVFDTTVPLLTELADESRRHAEAIQGTPRAAPSPDVEDRLKSWGYV